MKNKTKIDRWVKLVQQFHTTRQGMPFAESCYCGGEFHKWGSREDFKRCPDRSVTKNKQRMEALGKVING